ncbi:unnamed protein product [Rhodiola kirilowii]
MDFMESTGREQEVNFGRSLIVPSVQELAKGPISEIPSRYVRTDEDTIIKLDNLLASQSVPVIDLQNLGFGDLDDDELQKLHCACKDWGFFQVINHGVRNSLLEKFKNEIESFFKLTFEEKKLLWQRPDNHEGFGQLFVVSDEQKLDWSDMFYITTLPLNLRKKDLFEKLPEKLRETMECYCAEMKTLGLKILGQMAKALKMDAEEMQEVFGDGVQSMRMNYYPPCPEPEKAMGFAPHSDADAITILYQLNDTEGLQVRKDGTWVSIKPLKNALVVNMGDIMEIVSNGMYRSVEHRAIVNRTEERLSVATFYSSKLDSELGPAQSLVTPYKPAKFRRVPLEDYFKNFFARKLDGKAYLDFMKTGHQS